MICRFFPIRISSLETPWFYGILNPAGRYKLAPPAWCFHPEQIWAGGGPQECGPFAIRQPRSFAHATIRQGSDSAGYQPFALRSATRFDGAMGTRSRESIYGASVRAAAEQATEARKTADRLACEAWNKRMLGFQGPAQPSPALGDALNAGYLYLDVKCLAAARIKPCP